MSAFEILQQRAMQKCTETAIKMKKLELQHVYGNPEAESEMKRYFAFTEKSLANRKKQLEKETSC